MSRFAPLRAELRATVAVAAPLAAGNLAQMAMGFTDTVMVGHLGALPLAAAGLGAMIYFTAATAVQGVVTAVAPLAAHAIGAGDRDAAGRIAGTGLVLAAILALPFMVAMAWVDRLLVGLGYDPVLAGEIGRFLRALTWGAPAFLAFGALRSLLAALSRTRVVMLVLLACIGGNAALNWVLIYGHLGAPALGLVGSGYASAINQWLLALGLVAYLLAVPALAALRVFHHALAPSRSEMINLLRLGGPIAGMIALENGAFVAAGVLIGLLGATALGAHNVVLNCAGITFMVPLGIGQAATVRVAFELGAGRIATARLAGWVALALGVAFMSMTALLFWTLPARIVGVYLDVGDPANAPVLELAVRLMAIAALFQVFDGMQTIAAGALRGHRDTSVPMLLAAIGYWGVGFLGGCLFAFPLGQGVIGLWWGLALGLAAVALLLTVRLHRRAGRSVPRSAA